MRSSFTSIKLMMVFAVLGILAAPSVFAELFSDLSFDAASKKAAQTGKIVLIDFYTTWCGSCRLLDKRTWTDAEVIKLVGQKTVALRIDAEKELDLAKRYQIEAYPTVLLTNPDGTEMGRLIGYRDPKTFILDFDSALKGTSSDTKTSQVLPETGTNEPMFRMENGRALAQNGKYEAALGEYLWCFDQGGEVRPSFVWVRLSVLLGYMKDLAVHYPEAEKAMTARRDTRLSALTAGTTNEQTMVEIIYLNNALGQKEKNLAVLDHIPIGSPARSEIAGMMVDQLLEAKRYSDILGGADGKAAFAKRVDLYNEMTDQLNLDNPAAKATGEGYRHYTVKSGSQLFEALAGLKRNKDGEELAQQIFTFDATAAAHAVLISAATNAGNAELARYVK